MDDLSSDLELALFIADAADVVSSARFRAVDLVVDTKPDLTPVSDADRAVEVRVRELIAEHRPDDVVFGEEQGGAPAGGRRWILDPIDGTKSYVRGNPVWATLLALEVDGVVAVGVASAPALGRRWWASRGEGAWASDPIAQVPRRLQVSAVASLADASFCYSSLRGWGSVEGVLELQQQVWRTRGPGDFWSHLLVAEGVCDIAAEPDLQIYDVAALQVIVEEAGGRFSDRSGRPGPDVRSCVTTNGLLHEQVLGLLGV